MSAPTKDLCIIEFNEHSHALGTKKRVLNAFLEGIMCFQFRFSHKDKRGRVRKFEERVALPADADEECALEMAEYHFLRFINTAANLIANKA